MAAPPCKRQSDSSKLAFLRKKVKKVEFEMASLRMPSPPLFLLAVVIAGAFATCPHPLLDPVHCCTLISPPLWTAKWTTTAGSFELLVNRSAAPLGVDRFYNLVFYGYFQNTSQGVAQPENRAGFFRVVPGFVVQFGIAGLPPVSAAWQNQNLKDDPVVLSNTVGTIAYATAGPGTRTTQVYINLGDKSRLDREGFAPFGAVTKGMNVVSALCEFRLPLTSACDTSTA